MANPLTPIEANNRELLNATAAAYPELGWNAIIPAGAKDFYTAAADVIDPGASSFNAKQLLNQIYDDLLNRIGIVKVVEAVMNNPLYYWKDLNMPFGDFVEEMVVVPKEGHSYSLTDDGTWNTAGTDGPNPFLTDNRDIKSTLIQTNRAMAYNMGIRRIELAKAFTNANGYELARMIQMYMSICFTENTRDEYIYSKKLISTALNSKVYPLLPSQITTLAVDLRDPTITDEQTRTAITTIQNAISDMFYNSAAFNAGGIQRGILPQAVDIIMNKNAMNNAKVKSFALAYNPEYQTKGLEGAVLVESFGEGNEDIIAIAHEKRAFSIHDKQNNLASIYNPARDRFNSWYLRESVYAWSPFRQMIVIKAPKDSPVNVQMVLKDKQAMPIEQQAAEAEKANAQRAKQREEALK